VARPRATFLQLKIPLFAVHKITKSTAQTITLRSNTLVKSLFLFTEEDVRFEHNYFDLLPGELMVIPYKGSLQKDKLQWRHL
jgi:hypothetical protein